MRKSVIKSDPGYCEDSMMYAVYIDGVKNNLCMTADEELGMALVYTDNDKDSAYFDGNYYYKKIYGKVEIRRIIL